MNERNGFTTNNGFHLSRMQIRRWANNVQQKSMEMIVREIILFASKVNHLEQIQLIGKQR